MAGIVAAIATALVALFLTPLFENLPEATLGAIVVVAVSGMFKWAELRRLFKLRRADFWLAAIALFGVMTFEEVLYGLLIAVLASLVALVMRTRQSQISELGRLPGTLQFRSLRYHPESMRTDDLLIIRPDETIFFANAASIREGIRDMVEETDRPVGTVLLDLELTNELDVPGAEMVEELHEELQNLDTALILSGGHGPVEDLLRRSGALGVIGDDALFSSVAEAVLAFDETHPGPSTGEDREALVTRFRELAELAARHRDSLEPDQRARIAEAAALLDGIATTDAGDNEHTTTSPEGAE